MWDRADILKIRRAPRTFMAPIAGAKLIEVLQMTYTLRWATSLAFLPIADLYSGSSRQLRTLGV
eukprot:6213024-Pleurochrysis_carterae.AAC.3